MGQCLTINNKGQEHIQSCLPPNGAMQNIAEFYGIFSDSTRLKILSALSIAELCVGDLCAILSLNQTTISHQLKLMRDAKIVGARRDGKIIFYRIINPYVNEVMLTGVNNLAVV